MVRAQAEQARLRIEEYLSKREVHVTYILRPKRRHGLRVRLKTRGLASAVNRTYNSGQSRFITVDPIGMASASIGDPQSLNLFAYVTNNPVDFVDPSGLLLGGGITSYEVCEPEWVIVTNREGDTVDAYVEFQCVTKYELEKPETIDISEDCLELLNSIGIKERALQLMENPPLVDIDTLFGAPSIITGPESAPIELDFFPFSVATQPGFTRFRSLSALGETVGDTFNRLRGEGRALAYRGDGIDGIYFRGSLGDPRSNVYWLLHEVVHLVFPNSLDEDNTTDLDEYLIDHAGILRDEGQSASEAVSRFFNSECDPIYLEPPIVIGGN